MRRWGWLAVLFVLVAGLGAYAQEATGPTSDLVEKPLGRRFKFRILSAGLPGVETPTFPFDIRTQYQVVRGGETVATGYIGRYVYLDDVGTYYVSWNGNHGVFVNLRVPDGWDSTRCRDCWNRGVPVEVVPDTGPVVVPTIWVSHSPEIRGPHNDTCTIYRVRRSERDYASTAVGEAVSLMYGPERVGEVDDGICYADTLVHLSAGTYGLSINGTWAEFTLAEGESKHLQLAGLYVLTREAAFTVASFGDVGDVGPERYYDASRMLVVVPGRYLLNGWAVVDAFPGEIVTVRPDDRPRASLGVRVRPVAGGVEVTEIVEGGAAAAAGMLQGDVITEVAGTRVDSIRGLADALNAHRAGDVVEVVVRRPGNVTARVRATLRAAQ